MHFGIKKELKGHQLTAQAAYGLDSGTVQFPLEITLEELMLLGMDAKRADRVLQKLVDWAARNPEQNRKEILEQMARGIDMVL